MSELETRALALPERVRTLVIADDATYAQAAELFLTINGLIKEVEATFDPVIAKAHATHKEACAQKKRYYDPLMSSKTVVSTRMSVYRNAQEQLKREEQRQAQADAALQEAVDAEAVGDTTHAEQALNGQGVVAVPLAAPTPIVAGVSFTERWDYEVVDESLVPREFLMLDAVKIRRVVTALKAQTQIPGIRAIAKTSVVGRAA